jgi:hypothetical protein
MPNNFRHIGLIRLILPNAKIIMRGAIRWIAVSPASNSCSPKGRSAARSIAQGKVRWREQ